MFHFANDRSVTSGDGETLNTTTLYGAYNRNASHKTPSLQCPREEDEFSVSNGKLTYPVALLTIDEVAMAGGVNGQKNSFVLFIHRSKLLDALAVLASLLGTPVRTSGT